MNNGVYTKVTGSCTLLISVILYDTMYSVCETHLNPAEYYVDNIIPFGRRWLADTPILSTATVE